MITLNLNIFTLMAMTASSIYFHKCKHLFWWDIVTPIIGVALPYLLPEAASYEAAYHSLLWIQFGFPSIYITLNVIRSLLIIRLKFPAKVTSIITNGIFLGIIYLILWF